MRNFVKIISILLVLALICGIIVSTIPSKKTKEVYFFLRIKVLDPCKKPLKRANVLIYELTPEGAKLLCKGLSKEEGVYFYTLPINPEKKILRNIHVIASYQVNETLAYLGSITRSFHAHLKIHEIDLVIKTKELKLPKRAIKLAFALTSDSDGEVVGNCWKLTPVLEVYVQDKIYMWFDYPSGSVLDIQAKARDWDAITGEPISDWYDDGYTSATLDRGLSPNVKFTHIHYVLKLSFYYIDEVIYTGIPGIYQELVHVVDTDQDGYNMDVNTSFWNGSAPSSYERNTTTLQGYTEKFDITRPCKYVWYPTISMSVSYPWNISGSINIPLGVSKEELPKGKLYIEVSVIGGDWVCRSYDIDGGWLKSVHVWEEP